MTFNHHAYIEDAMNGFCMQQTNFPFVCIIVDDASTDGEPEVIKKYFDVHFDLSESGETDDYVMTFGRHKTNENCYFAVLYLKYNHYSIKKSKEPYYVRWQDNAKYIALCEGDDYWIAKDKLQKQVDFLEKNKEYVLVYTMNKTLNNTTGKIINSHNKTYSGELTKKLLIYGNFIPTLSVLHRNHENEFLKIYKEIPFQLKMGDKPKWIIYSQLGKIWCIEQRMVMYRVLVESASHSKDINKVLSFYENGKKITEYFNKLYNIGLSDKYIDRFYRIIKFKVQTNQSKKTVLHEYFKLIKDYPLQIFNFKLIAIIVKRFLRTN